VPRLLAGCGAPVRTLVCPPGVDARAPAPRPENAALQVISIGAVTELKGLTDGLRALARLPAASWRWTIVGHLGVAPDYAAALAHETRALGLEHNVLFTGQYEREQTLALLERSDVLLLPSYTENCPLVALEALAVGVPVVGYRVGGLPDIVQHEEAGLLAPLLDVEALSGYLARFAQDIAERHRLARAARAAGNALMSWQQAAAHFQSSMQRELSRIGAANHTPS
jgi:glycosyltransferase involved in cell wall biosynthesis